MNKHAYIFILGSITTLIVGCQIPIDPPSPIPLEKIAVYSELGDDFTFYVPHTDVAFQLGDYTHRIIIKNNDLNNFICQIACQELTEKGFNAEPVKKGFPYYDELRKNGFSACLTFQLPKNNPPGIGILSQISDTFFLYNKVDKKSYQYFLHMNVDITDISKSMWVYSNVRTYDPGLIIKKAELDHWPEGSDIGNLELKGHINQIKTLLQPEIKKAIDTLMIQCGGTGNINM